MFGLKKRRQDSLFIKTQDVIEFIKEDYEDSVAFSLMEIRFEEKEHIIGSCLVPYDAEENKENIRFVFDDNIFDSIDEFIFFIKQDHAIGNLETIIEVVKAGIINGEAVLKSPWYEERLAQKAVNN